MPCDPMDQLTDQQRAWALHSEALWTRATDIARTHPRIDAGDVYHAPRKFEILGLFQDHGWPWQTAAFSLSATSPFDSLPPLAATLAQGGPCVCNVYAAQGVAESPRLLDERAPSHHDAELARRFEIAGVRKVHKATVQRDLVSRTPMSFAKPRHLERNSRSERECVSPVRTNRDAEQASLRAGKEQRPAVVPPHGLIAAAARDYVPARCAGKMLHRYFGSTGLVGDVTDPTAIR